jgi:hypothetical protein
LKLHDLQGLGSLTKIWLQFSEAWDRVPITTGGDIL